MSSAPSSADAVAFDAAIDAVADRVIAAMADAEVPTVLLDGRSGSGKTTLAARVAARRDGLVVVALDDVYPGWDGLDEGVAAVTTDLLAARLQGEPATWRPWDWAAGAPGERHAVPAGTALLVEGSGILTPESAGYADIRVWLESSESSRRERALLRDGDLYRPHWARWAAQEAQHLARDRPAELATIVAEIP